MFNTINLPRGDSKNAADGMIFDLSSTSPSCINYKEKED